MLEWSDLQLVLAICRSGSLSGAAKALGLNHSTVFRRINSIEHKLDVRFFERLPQGYVMTEAGEAAQRSAERMEEEVLGLTREILGRDLRLQGSIRVTAPEGIAVELLTPLVLEFGRRHPDIRVEVIVTSEALVLSRREADIALRVTSAPPDTSIGRCIGIFRFCVYGSHEYLAGKSELQLQDYNWLMIESEVDWLIPHIWSKKEKALARIPLVSSNSSVILKAVNRGSGVTLLPCFRGDAQPGLVRVGEPIEALTKELWVLTHPDLRHTARVKALMMFLYEALVQQKPSFAGSGTKLLKK